MKDSLWFRSRTQWRALLSLLTVCIGLPLAQPLAQAPKQLKKEKAYIEQQLQHTQQKLSTTQRQKEGLKKEVRALKEDLSTTDEVLDTLSDALQRTRNQLSTYQDVVQRLTDDIELLKGEYTALVRNMYRQKLQQHKYAYLLGATNVGQLFLRWQYLKQVDAFRKKQVDTILLTQQQLQKKIAQLRDLQTAQTYATDSVQTEQQQLKQDWATSQATLQRLHTQEAQLLKDLEGYKRKSQQLQTAISTLLAQAQRQAEVAPPAPKSPTPPAPAPNKKAAAALRVPETHAVTQLTGEFVKHKGRLPWPTTSGSVIRQFGNQPHPTLKGVRVPSKGIDIVLPTNTAIKSIFEGTVVGIFSIPGYENSVIVKHGSYYSVYSNLATVSVRTQQAIATQQALGLPAKSIDGSAYLVHFELWKGGNTPINPIGWLQR